MSEIHLTKSDWDNYSESFNNVAEQSLMEEERKAKTLEALSRIWRVAGTYEDIDFIASELGLLDEWKRYDRR